MRRDGKDGSDWMWRTGQHTASIVEAGSRERENRPYSPRRAKRGESQSVRVEENRDRWDSARGLTLAEESAKRMKKIGRRKVVRRRREDKANGTGLRTPERGEDERKYDAREREASGSHRKGEGNRVVKILTPRTRI